MSRKKLQDIAIILDFGKRVRQLRGDLSQEEFGKLFGVHKSTVCRWETGTIPDREMRRKIAAYGNLTEEWLLRGEAPVAQLLEHTPDYYEARRPAPLDEDLIIQVVATVEEYLAATKIKRRPLQKGRLIAMIYDHCLKEKEKPNSLLVKRYLPLAD